MRKIILILALIPLIFISCTKKEEKDIKKDVDYKAPGLKFYGKWEVVGGSEYDGDVSQYYIFEESTNQIYFLTSNEVGYHRLQAQPIYADATTISFYNQNFKYEIKGDSLILRNSPDIITLIMVVSTDALLDPQTWVKPFNAIKTVTAPTSTHAFGFGVNGDNLYISARPYVKYNLYKLNSLNGNLEDSVDVGFASSAYFKNAGNELFFARGYSSNNIKKIANFGAAAVITNASSNILPSTSSISYNISSGTIYAFTSARKLFTGSDGGNFTELTDLSASNASCLVYAGNDEFYCIVSSRLCKAKISPTFQVLTTYSNPNISSISSIGTDGTSLWIYAYNNSLSLYEFTKISL